MRGITARRWALILVGGAIVGAGALAGAWHPTGNSPFTLPPSTGSNPPVWMPTKGAQRVGVRVTTAGGKTNVKAGASAGTAALLGAVPAGVSALFEGAYGYLNVEADATGTATGSWDARVPGLPSDADQVIGQGSVALPLPSGSTNYFFYGNDSPVSRLVTVQAGAQPVTVVDGQSTPLVALEAGDWTCCVRNVRKYGLLATGAGSATHAWMVADAPTTPDAYAWQYAGAVSCQQNDAGDSVSLDGSVSVMVTVTNTSSVGSLVVTSTGGSQPQPATVPPGQSTSCAGHLTSFSWTYSQGSMSAGLVVRRN